LETPDFHGGLRHYFNDYDFIPDLAVSVELKLFPTKEIDRTRLSGRFGPVIFFNCEHFLFVNIVIQNQTKKFADFIKKIVAFKI